MAAVLSVRDLSIGFHTKNAGNNVVEDVNFDVYHHHKLGVVGESAVEKVLFAVLFYKYCLFMPR
jgi:ABC-type microcin C transport system duplicated ATPase subunit YejF